MAPPVVLFCVSSALAESGPSLKWVWETTTSLLMHRAPETLVLTADDRPSEAIAWAVAATLHRRRVTLRANGTQRDSRDQLGPVWGGTGWQNRSRAIVTAAKRAQDRGSRVEVIGLTCEDLDAQSETLRRLSIAESEGLLVSRLTWAPVVEAWEAAS